MAGRLHPAVATLAFLLISASVLPAQDMGEYSFEMLPDGTPRFTQVLRWDPDPDVREYEVTVETAEGVPVSTHRLEQPVLRLDLPPGAYRYRVVLTNLLGKPEVDLPWRSFTVLKAEIPGVTEVSPKVWFIDDLKPEVTLSGENLAPGVAVVLKPSSGSAAPIAGKEVERKGTSTVRVAFSGRGVAAGEYTIVVTNPGGLEQTLPAALAVRYERPVDVAISLGYDPWFSLYDSWFLESWPGTFFPLGASARLSVWFIKKPYGHFGVELAMAGRLMTGGLTGAIINSEIGQAGLNGVYRFPFSRWISATARIGGGAALSHHAFDYDGTAGAGIASVDLFVSAGLSLQWYVTKHIFLDAGADWTHVFANGFSEGGLTPFLAAGVLF